MAPTPTGTASCIAWPRIRNRRAVSASSSEPTAQSAEYSPNEWPATKSAMSSIAMPSASNARSAAIEVAISAGWAFLVRVSSSMLPSQIRVESFSSRASSTSSNTAFGRRIGLGQGPSHADGLCPLARKYECTAHLALLLLRSGLPRADAPRNACAQLLCKARGFRPHQSLIFCGPNKPEFSCPLQIQPAVTAVSPAHCTG